MAKLSDRAQRVTDYVNMTKAEHDMIAKWKDANPGWTADELAAFVANMDDMAEPDWEKVRDAWDAFVSTATAKDAGGRMYKAMQYFVSLEYQDYLKKHGGTPIDKDTLPESNG